MTEMPFTSNYNFRIYYNFNLPQTVLNLIKATNSRLGDSYVDPTNRYFRILISIPHQ